MSTKKLQIVGSLSQPVNVDSTLTQNGVPANASTVGDEISRLDSLIGDSTVSEQISSAIANKADSAHTHDGRYYTESEIDTKLNEKSNVDHTHEISELIDLSDATVGHAATADTADEAIHATTADTANAVAWGNVTGKPSTYTPATHSHAISNVTNLQTSLDAKVPTSRTVNGKTLSANIVLSASDVGADVSGAASSALASAKEYTDAEISEWVGDTPVSEQISTAIASKSDTGHTHDDRYYTESEINTKLSGKSDTSHTHSAYVNQNAFSNVKIGDTTIAADTTTDTLTLVAGDNVTLTPDSTNDKVTISAKDTVYTHPSSGVTAGTYKSVTVNAQGHVTGGSNPTTLSGYGITDAAAKSHGHSNATTAAAGFMSATDKSTLDNLDNLVGDTSVSEQITEAIVDKVDKIDGKGLSTNDYTTTEKNKLAGIASGAEVNQNAFSNVVVGSTTIAADAKTDTLTIAAGNNVTITPDATNDKITIAAKDTVYTHPTYTSKSSGLYKVTVDGTGHVSAATAVAKSDITALGIPAQDTTYSAATTSAAGLMSASDKSKLDGIASGANKITVDSALSSSSTNPVQNKVVNTAISNLNTLVGDTAVSTQISNAVASKAPTSHASTATTYGAASASNYGHAMASSTTPKANGTAAVGSETAKFARGDHVHPLQTTVSGNAGSATKLATARTIDGVSFDGSAAITHYGTCSTAAATAAKTVALTGFTLATGARVVVKFTVTNTAASPTLNVNSTGAKAIMYRGSAISKGYLAANRVYEFIYDGTDWELIGDVDTNTTYSNATASKAGLMSAIDKSTLDNLDTLVGDTAVSTQINNAISALDSTVYIGSSEPTGNVDVWIDTDEEQSQEVIDVLDNYYTKNETENVLLTGTSANSNKLGGKAPEYYLPAVNLLDNSDWRVKENIINQRGQDTYSGSGYRIDRWFSYIENATATINNGYITLTGANFIQKLPPNTLKNNTYYTLAAKRVTGEILTNTQRFPMTAASGHAGLYMSLMDNDGDDVGIITDGDFEWTALYEGTYTADTMPPYVSKGYAAELLACGVHEKGSPFFEADALTLEEIKASTDLTGKIPNAAAVQAIVGNIQNIKVDNGHNLMETGVDVPSEWGSVIRIWGRNWGPTFVSDSYFLHITAVGDLYTGMQVNGATDITWTLLSRG